LHSHWSGRLGGFSGVTFQELVNRLADETLAAALIVAGESIQPLDHIGG
jgi:hypothetical protein